MVYVYVYVFSSGLPVCSLQQPQTPGPMRGRLTFCRFLRNKVSVLPCLFCADSLFNLWLWWTKLVLVWGAFLLCPPGHSRFPWEALWGMARAHTHSVPLRRRRETSDSSSLTPPPKNVKTGQNLFIFGPVMIRTIILTLKLLKF